MYGVGLGVGSIYYVIQVRQIQDRLNGIRYVD